MESPETEIILLLGIIELCKKVNESKGKSIVHSENLTEQKKQEPKKNQGDILKCRNC